MILNGKILCKNIYQNAIERLPLMFKKYPTIAAAYIFGSQVTGKTTNLSDLDIAVLVKKQINFNEELKLIGDITDVLETDEFDLVILNTSPPYIQYEVFSKGQLFYETDRGFRIDFQTMAFQKYFDIKPFYDEYNYYLKKRILEGRVLSE